MADFQPDKFSDHDLLIELRTEMRGMRGELKELRDNTSKRVDDLEVGKVGREEVLRLKGEADKIHNDHETRIRGLEKEGENLRGKYVIIGTLTMVGVSAVVSYLVSNFP